MCRTQIPQWFYLSSDNRNVFVEPVALVEHLFRYQPGAFMWLDNSHEYTFVFREDGDIDLSVKDKVTNTVSKELVFKHDDAKQLTSQLVAPVQSTFRFPGDDEDTTLTGVSVGCRIKHSFEHQGDHTKMMFFYDYDS